MRHEQLNLEKRKLQYARIMSGKFRATFLKHPTGQSVLWHILVYHCRIFQKIHSEDAQTRHNMGIELMEMCRLVDNKGTPAQLFEQVQKLKKPKKKWFRGLRRKR